MTNLNPALSQPTSTAHVKTEQASRYLQQLCKHWGHKFTVQFDANRGRIDYGDGQVVFLSADAGVLQMTVQGNDVDGLPKLESVVAEHIQRFAFKESLVFDWVRQS